MTEQSPAPQTMRVGMFSESFHPVQNGVTTSVLTLIAALRALNHHVCIFAPAHQQQRETQAHVLRFPSFVSFLNREYPLAYPFLPRLALETHFDHLKLDVVHTHTPFVLGLTGANLAIQRDIPLVTTFHTLYASYAHYVPFLPDSVTQTLLEHYIPWYYNRCDEIICPSGVAATALRDMGVSTAITVIPTGIPMPPEEAVNATARERARRQLDLSHTTPILLYAGRLAREKNLDLLIEVFLKVRCRLPEAQLLIAGGGPYAEELQERVRDLDVATAVRFLGSQPHTRMNSLYAAADVFCFPSPSETQGLVIGEARAAGTPCVVMDAGGAPETVQQGEDGFRIPPNDPAEFAARILQILTDASLAHRLRRNARTNAAEFTPERMVHKVLDVYERARCHPHPKSGSMHGLLEPNIDWEAVGRSLYETLRP